MFDRHRRVTGLAGEHARAIGTEGMRDIGENWGKIAHGERSIRCVNALRELVQRQASVSTRPLEDLDHALTVLVGQAGASWAGGWYQRHNDHCA
jgi:hypothetical protein